MEHRSFHRWVRRTGGEPTRMVQLFQKEAERRKFLVLAPKSRFATWE